MCQPSSAAFHKAVGPDDRAAEEELAEAIDKALRDLAAGAATAAGAAALSSGVDNMLNGLDWGRFSTDMTAAMQVPLAGIYLSKSFRAMYDLSEVTAVLDFASIEARAIQFATTQAGLRVVQVTQEVRENVRAVTLQGLEDGLGRRERAQLIAQFIPLHERYATAVLNTHDRTLRNSLKAGRTLDEAAQDAAIAAEKHSVRLTKARAMAIAKTEVMTATNTGRFEGWAAEIQAGNYSTGSRKEWVAGDMACDICDPSTGEVVPWDQPFQNGEMMPPMHVNCRCTAVLLPPDIELRGPTSPTDPGWRAEEQARRAQQREQGKADMSKARAVHRAPASNPEVGGSGKGSITNAQGRVIAASTLSMLQGRTSTKDHRALVASIIGDAPAPVAAGEAAKPVSSSESRDFTIANTGGTTT